MGHFHQLESIRSPSGTFLGSFLKDDCPTSKDRVTPRPGDQYVVPTQPPCSVALIEQMPFPVLNVSWYRFPVAGVTSQVSRDSGVKVTGNLDDAVASTWNGFSPSEFG